MNDQMNNTSGNRSGGHKMDETELSRNDQMRRDAGVDSSYNSGIGSGASDVGSGSVGVTDDDLRSIDTDDVRVSSGSTAMSGRTIAAVFTDWNGASRAVEELRNVGFGDAEIGIARVADDGDKLQGSGTAEVKDQAKGVAGGVATGAAVGGVTGLLAALASLLIPGVGPIVAGGVLATTFGSAAGAAVAGAGIGAGIGAVAGGLVGSLTSIGLPEEEARSYEEALRSGSTLVTVSSMDRTTEAKRILERNGGRSNSPNYDTMT